jgi:NADH:ubiquinone oxidoreductase subunit 2 (subunit N)
VDALKTIKYCAFITAGMIVAAGVCLRIVAFSNNEDPAGALVLGFIAAIASIVVGTVAAVFEKTLQSAVGVKSENDLTI